MSASDSYIYSDLAGEERFSLVQENGKLMVTDDFPNEPFNLSSFWDSITRSRVNQLRNGAQPLVSASEFSNKYHIACTELNKKGVIFNGNVYYKTINLKAHFELSQEQVEDVDYLVVDQLDGPAFYGDTLRSNKFFCAALGAKRAKQLSMNMKPIIQIKDPLMDPLKIAKEEINKGIYFNGEFVSGKTLGCGK